MGRADEKRDQRAAAAEELQIDRGIDAQAAGAPDRAEKINNECEESRSAQRDNIFRGNPAADVEDRTIFLKDKEINIFRADPVDGAADGRICQDGRALFDQLDEQNSLAARAARRGAEAQ